MNIHIPAQRQAPDEVAATAASTPVSVELGWGRVLRISAARASLALIASLVLWSVLPLLVGFTPRVILSGSMEPRIHVGDIIVTRTVPAATLSEGQVITVKDPDHPGRTRTHRLQVREADGVLVTKGDANREADSSKVSVDDVLGLGVIRVPFVGRPAYWLAEHNWLALGATTLFLGWAILTALPGSRRPVEDADDQDGPTTGSGSSRPSGIPSRTRRVAATVAVAAVAVGVGVGPADAAFRTTATSSGSTWSAAASFAVSYAQTVLGDSPEFYWRLDESKGSTATDAASGRNGQVSGSWSWGQDGALSGQGAGTALRIDGGYVSQPVSLTSSKNFSVETWFRTSRTSGGALLSLITGSGVERSLYLGSDGKVRFGLDGTAIVTSGQALNDGAWHQVAYTNAGSGGSRARLYVDGSRVDTASKGVTSSASGNWRAGQAQWNSNWDGRPDQFFRGDLDEVAVYGATLSAQQVSDHYAGAN